MNELFKNREKNYTWDTEFNTVLNTMTHIFSNRVAIVADFNSKLVILYKDGTRVQHYEFADFLLIEKYEKLLLRTAKEASELGGFMQEI